VTAATNPAKTRHHSKLKNTPKSVIDTSFEDISFRSEMPRRFRGRKFSVFSVQCSGLGAWGLGLGAWGLGLGAWGLGLGNIQ
jgi:hypothetical protein